MGDDRLNAEQEPAIALRQIAAARNAVMEHWRIGWEVKSQGTQPLKILAARLPHGQFKSEEIRFTPPLVLSPGASEKFHTSVRCHEPSGPVTENAFVIFQVIWSSEAWRIFARVKVVVGDDGEPAAATESVTTQKVGFSGIRV